MNLRIMAGMVMIVRSVIPAVFMVVDVRARTVHVLVFVLMQVVMGVCVAVLVAVFFVPVGVSVVVHMAVFMSVEVFMLMCAFHNRSLPSQVIKCLPGFNV